MATNYDHIAEEYRASKLLPWRMHVEAFTLFQLTGKLEGLHVLDLACGEGFYTRQIKLRGAKQVTGVDISAEMIRLAREAENNNPLGLVYHVQDVLSLQLNEKFDLVCASYLLNYARNSTELLQMGLVIADHLKPDGCFVTVNSNPDFRCPVNSMRQYGFTRENEGDEEGAEIIYRFYQEDGSHVAVTNYHLKKSTHETALVKAGFSDIQWHALKVSPEGVNQFGRAYWTPVLNCQPVIGLTCIRS